MQVTSWMAVFVDINCTDTDETGTVMSVETAFTSSYCVNYTFTERCKHQIRQCFPPSHKLVIKSEWAAGWLLEFYVLATSNFISGQPPTCDGVHSWWLHSAAPLGDQAASTMTWYLIQSHYPDTECARPCHTITILSIWPGSDKYQFVLNSFVCLDLGSNLEVRFVWSTKTGDKTPNSFCVSGEQLVGKVGNGKSWSENQCAEQGLSAPDTASCH